MMQGEGTGGEEERRQPLSLKSRFQVVRRLGQGTYGKVTLAVCRDSGAQVAIKTIAKARVESQADLTRIRREIQIMSSVRHPHIVHIYEGTSLPFLLRRVRAR